MKSDFGLVPGDNAYFMNGGVSTRLPKEGFWQMPAEPEPELWICRYCGSSNPGDIWECSHCPAPRSEATREEESTWLPPTQVIPHIEKEPRPGISPIPVVSSRSSAPPVPWWIVILTIFSFVLSFVTGVGTFSAILFTGNPLSVVLWTAAFIACFYAFCKLRKVIHDRYDYEIIDWDIG